MVAFTLTGPTAYGIKSLRMYIVLTEGTTVEISIQGEAVQGASAPVRQLNNRLCQALIKGICNLKTHAFTLPHEESPEDPDIALQPTKESSEDLEEAVWPPPTYTNICSQLDGVRLLENPTLCDPALCKNNDGQWTKWVRERLNPEQEEVLECLNRKCDSEELIKNTSQNFRMRVMHHDF